MVSDGNLYLLNRLVREGCSRYTILPSSFGSFRDSSSFFSFFNILNLCFEIIYRGIKLELILFLK